jgi:hypothetical protein
MTEAFAHSSAIERTPDVLCCAVRSASRCKHRLTIMLCTAHRRKAAGPDINSIQYSQGLSSCVRRRRDLPMSTWWVGWGEYQEALAMTRLAPGGWHHHGVNQTQAARAADARPADRLFDDGLSRPAREATQMPQRYRIQPIRACWASESGEGGQCGMDKMPPRESRTATQKHLDTEITAAVTAKLH